MASPSSKHPGITVRHSRRCGIHEGRPCSCTPSYRAEVWSARDGKKIRKDGRTLAEAKAWRADAMGELCRGTRRASVPLTVAEAAEAGSPAPAPARSATEPVTSTSPARSAATRRHSASASCPSSARVASTRSRAQTCRSAVIDRSSPTAQRPRPPGRFTRQPHLIRALRLPRLRSRRSGGRLDVWEAATACNAILARRGP